MIALSPEAFRLWKQFYNAVEVQGRKVLSFMK